MGRSTSLTAAAIHIFIHQFIHYLLDINECLEEEHNCTATEEICLNTRGGHKCLKIPKEDCLTGFTFNNLTKLCEGHYLVSHLIPTLTLISYKRTS